MNFLLKIILVLPCFILISCIGTTQTSEDVNLVINPPPADTVKKAKAALPPLPKVVYKDAADSLKAGMEHFNSGFRRIMKESTGIEKARQEYDRALEILYPLRNRTFFKDKEQNALGLLLESDKNPEEAVKYYQLAMEANNKDAMYNLAACYEYGTGVGKDIKKAGDLYLKSARSGNAMGMTVVAINMAKYNEGMFVPNVSESVKWYEKSLEYKDELPYDRLELVYKRLTDYYKEGVGVDRSISIAEHYGKLYEEQKKFNDKFYSDRFFDR